MIEKHVMKQTLALIVIGFFLGTSMLPATGAGTIPQKTSDHFISIKDATQVACSKLIELQKTQYCIVQATEIQNLKNPLFYVFDLYPQGYLVVSGSYDLPPVIAYSFTNNFQDPSGQHMLQDILTADLMLRLEDIPYLPATMIQERHQTWETYLQERTLVSRGDFTQWPPEGSTPTGGWLLTDWHQGSPYNDLCPLDLVQGGRSVAGCPAVAMAQILNYHNTTMNIIFTDADDYYHNYGGNQYWIDNDYVTYGFPSFPQLDTYLTSLQNHYINHVPPLNIEKAALTFACGIAAHQVYSSSVSGTYGVSQAVQAYQRFNCTSIELLNENNPELYGRLAHNMMDALPAHLAVVDPGWTIGHNVVVDGYNTDGYYHVNFGWGGSYDGWYLIPDELPYGLTVIEGLIVDILKPDTGTPDLDATGFLNWTDVTPGNSATGSFNVINIGEIGSDLAWQITGWPAWGTWAFTPQCGHDVFPEGEPQTVSVSVIAPAQQNQQYTGFITVTNMDDSTDYRQIPVSLHTNGGIQADLQCTGSFTWTGVRIGAVVNGAFTVQNIGTAHSNLSWTVASWPDWGNWSFEPAQGTQLTPEDGALTINVSVIAPDKKKTEFSGEIIVVNTENSSDFGVIPVSLVTPYIPHPWFSDILQVLLNRFPYLFSFLRLFLNR